MKLLSIVCPNGLGHFRRTVAILSQLLAIRADLDIDLACADWQIERMKSTLRLPADWSRRVRHLTGLTEPGVHGADNAAIYADGRLRNWEKRFAQLDIASFDAVLSDNLAGILSLRPDAILLGSFLWCEVLEAGFPGDAVVREFAAWERQLLARTRPPMLCVGALATPAVLGLTRAVDVGFTLFDDVAPVVTQLPAKGPWRVAILGGATEAAAALHEHLIRGLLADPRWELALGKGDMAAAGVKDHPRVVPFEFGPDSYRACSAIIARPGMGTVSEAMAAGVPMVCSYEMPQLEMTHVAQRLAELGLARDFGSADDAGALGAVLQELLRPEVRGEFDRARSRQPLDGVQRAAAWLDTHLASIAVAGAKR